MPLISIFPLSGIKIPLRHAANSAAILDIPESYLDMVRPGLIIYGMYPSKEVKRTIELLPVLRLKTKVVLLRNFTSGKSISYGRTYFTKKNTRIAVIPIGYGHGYNRALSNKCEVIIRGKRAPVVGIVCMDQCMVDAGHIPDVAIGDEVVLIGKQGGEEILAEEVAVKINSIPYEVTCSLGKNLPRVYLGEKIENRD